MALFSSLLGAGVSLLGSKIAGGQERSAAGRALVQPQDVRSPFGVADFTKAGRLTARLGPETQGIFSSGMGLAQRSLDELGSLDFEGREAAELERLRTLRRPEIEDARNRLQERLFARGRLGAARGGGLSGGMFNPETAALEEAVLRSQLSDIGSAREFSRGEQAFLGNQAQGLFGLGAGAAQTVLNQSSLGFQQPAGTQALQAQPGFNAAQRSSQFFGGLANQIAGTDFGDVFKRVSSGGLFL